jgi:hypothetical protein
MGVSRGAWDLHPWDHHWKAHADLGFVSNSSYYYISKDFFARIHANRQIIVILSQANARQLYSTWTWCSQPSLKKQLARPGWIAHLGDARDMLDFTFSNPACPDSGFECAGTSRSPTLPTLPDLDSMSSSRHTEFGLPSPASTASCTDLSEIDWDTIMGIETAPAQSGGMQCLDSSSDLKDWAWMDAAFPTLPLPESPLDDFQYNPSDDELGIGLKSEDSLASKLRETKPRPTKKRSHNAIERKYRESVNSKLVKIDGWLFEHRTRSKKG